MFCHCQISALLRRRRILSPGWHDTDAQAGQICGRVKWGFRQNSGIKARFSLDRSMQWAGCRGLARIQVASRVQVQAASEF